MANNTSSVTCPEIAKENDSDIELSSYNTSVGAKVVIGCKGFGRHVSDPTNVVCLDTGAWSETPNLKCKIAFDQEEKIILGAAIASAVLVLFVVICLCCYCCCCRRRRRHYWHRYRSWRGRRNSERDDWRNGWSGWGNHMHFGDYSGSDKVKKTSWRSEWKKRKDMINHEGDDKDMRGGMWSGWSSRKDVSNFHDGENEKKGGRWTAWNSRKDIDDYPADKKEKTGWWSAWGSRKDLDDHHGDDKEGKGAMWSRWSKRTEFDEHPKEDEGRKSGWWRRWKDRVLDHSGYDSTEKRHYRYQDSNEGKNFIQEYGYPIENRERKNSFSDRTPNLRYSRRFSNDDKHSVDRKEIIRSKTHEYNAPTEVRRYSDPSIHNYGRYEVIYDSKPTVEEYHRVRRYSDPMAHTVNYVRPRQEIIHQTRPITFHESYNPSYSLVGANEGPQQIIERDSIEYNRPAVRYSSPYVYSGPAHVLDPIYYTEPHLYRSSPRVHRALHGSDRLLLGHGHGRRHRQLILDPVELDKISNYAGIDFNHRNVSRLSRHPRIIELGSADRHGTSLLSKGDIGRSSGAHYEVTTIQPSTTYFKGRHDIPIDSRSGAVDDKVRNYVLYQGKGKTTEILDSAAENGDKSQIIY